MKCRHACMSCGEKMDHDHLWWTERTGFISPFKMRALDKTT